jgi:hypothetical protein
MNLEAQLTELAALGLALEPNVTIDDLLYSFDNAMYEERPFDLVLFMLGSEVEREPCRGWLPASGGGVVAGCAVLVELPEFHRLAAGSPGGMVAEGGAPRAAP